MNLKFIRQLASKGSSALRGFFSWLTWGNFLDTPGEWHASLEGFADGFCLRPAQYRPWGKGKGDKNLLQSLRKEHHYYNISRALGFAAIIVLLSGMVVWIVSSAIK